MMFYAHSTNDISKQNWQTLQDHLLQVANLCQIHADKFGAGSAGKLAGLLHDLGKYSAEFQARLLGGKSVDHSTAGAVEVINLSPTGQKLVVELLAYVIAGHHTGLPDKLGNRSLFERLKTVLPEYNDVWRKELTVQVEDLLPQFKWERVNLAFQFSVLGRMLFSCLIDADRRDTENFYANVEGREVDRVWPKLPLIVDALIASFNVYMANKSRIAENTDVNRLRSEILTHVRGKASETSGLFTLTVPTGGGKTLASLAFALDHAKIHCKERIIYAIPFTSIIDQTATIFRDVLGDEVILEHHSALEEEKDKPREGKSKLQLAMEDWAAPVVITTNVQLFESLFANRTSRCRKLHNLANSIIILDEAQTIPPGLLRPCVAMLDELARNYGVTIVLCTATQPALAAPDFVGGFAQDAIRELAPDPTHLYSQLKRVSVHHAGILTNENLIAALHQSPQALVIVNSRKHALELFQQAKKAGISDVIHLTTRQYAAHRRKILAGLRDRLENKQPCRVIATSLVEAGVDLDFPLVWRSEAGLEQIAQAAGRCNREGKNASDTSIVTVFKPADYQPPHEVKQLAEAAGRVMKRHDDMLSLEAIRDYFNEVYWVKGDNLDKYKVLEKFITTLTETNFAYRTVAEDFKMIESGMVAVIIAHDDKAKAAIAELTCNPNVNVGAVARQLQTCLVQVPPKARAILVANDHVKFIAPERFGDQFAVLQADHLYKDEIGLIWEDADYIAAENSII